MHEEPYMTIRDLIKRGDDGESPFLQCVRNAIEASPEYARWDEILNCPLDTNVGKSCMDALCRVVFVASLMCDSHEFLALAWINQCEVWLWG